MKTATITEAKNGLSALIDRVRAGEGILITDRGRVVARLEPATSSRDLTGRLQRLERAGIVRVARSASPLEVLRRPGPSLALDTSAVQPVIDERASGH
jgi:prevent-host-death family protein